MKCNFFQESNITTDGPSTCYIPDISNVIPRSIDYVIVYSTLYGCASFRHPEKGSIFIEKLCQFLQPEFARENDFITILQRVREEIQHWNFPKGYENTIQNGEEKDEKIKYVTQVSEESSTLTKKVYFDVK